MASGVPNPSKKKLIDGSIDLDTDAFKFTLHTSAMTPDYDAWDFRNDLTNEVANGNGYTTGGVALSGLSISVDLTNDRAEWTFTAPAWAASTITARYGAICKIRGGASSADEIVLIIDFVADKISTNGTFTVTPDAEGVLQVA